MFEGHDPYLVALSVVIAILGGYTGFSLAARIRGTPDVSHRVLLAGAAAFLAVGIWTMHFVGMLAAPIPADTVYLVLPTIVSFLICVLVVGISLFFVSIGEPSLRRVVWSAVLLGAGVARAGMHYTAMDGMHFIPLADGSHHHIGGLAASQQILSVVVALLCFVIAAGFLLSLVPDPRRQAMAATIDPVAGTAAGVAQATLLEHGPAPLPRPMSAPLGGLGQPPRAAPAPRLPVEGANGTHFINSADVRSVRADAHYTRVHDGTRERMCPWSISEAEAQLDPGLFVRVHRSHIVAIPHVTFVRKEGDGAVIELDGPSPHRVPVSRAKIAEVKARLGLARRHA